MIYDMAGTTDVTKKILWSVTSVDDFDSHKKTCLKITGASDHGRGSQASSCPVQKKRDHMANQLPTRAD